MELTDKPTDELLQRQLKELEGAELRECPLCGDQENVYTSVVTGHLRDNAGLGQYGAEWGACQMVRCAVCGIMLISPTNVVQRWNEGRGRHKKP